MGSGRYSIPIVSSHSLSLSDLDKEGTANCPAFLASHTPRLAVYASETMPLFLSLFTMSYKEEEFVSLKVLMSYIALY